ncbi:hypothetical protein RRG08_048990 [Elysia crispata]|uniref:Uncharacterized protein n=1 Tax=Elysia crispata TaxID=231223 RepID=A0AAE1CWV6_9GAST|nr:hypothetical protein RRG08_048990 [Elysia crispata]
MSNPVSSLNDNVLSKVMCKLLVSQQLRSWYNSEDLSFRPRTGTVKPDSLITPSSLSATKSCSMTKISSPETFGQICQQR